MKRSYIGRKVKSVWSDEVGIVIDEVAEELEHGERVMCLVSWRHRGKDSWTPRIFLSVVK